MDKRSILRLAHLLSRLRESYNILQGRVLNESIRMIQQYITTKNEVDALASLWENLRYRNYVLDLKIVLRNISWTRLNEPTWGVNFLPNR